MRLEGTEVPSKVRPIPHGLCVLGLTEVQKLREMLASKKATEVRSS